MTKQKIKVQGLSITIESINNDDYISLTDIAKQSTSEPKETIRNWIRNTGTLRFLWTWEKLHNPDFKGVNIDTFIGQTTDNRFNFSPTRWIEDFNAIGIISKRGRYGGGTLAHKDIALEFCTWLSPEFKVYFIKEFQRLKEEEFSRKNLEWHISKITDNIDEVRNLLDTIPGQKEELNRLKK